MKFHDAFIPSFAETLDGFVKISGLGFYVENGFFNLLELRFDNTSNAELLDLFHEVGGVGRHNRRIAGEIGEHLGRKTIIAVILRAGVSIDRITAEAAGEDAADLRLIGDHSVKYGCGRSGRLDALQIRGITNDV